MIGKRWLLIITLGFVAWTHAWGQYEIDRDFDMTPFYFRHIETGVVIGFEELLPAVIEKIGEPDSIIERDGLYTYRWDTGIEGVGGTGYVTQWRVQDTEQWETTRGIRIGDDRHYVAKAYDGYEERIERERATGYTRLITFQIPSTEYLEEPRFGAVFEYDEHNQVVHMEISLDFR